MSSVNARLTFILNLSPSDILWDILEFIKRFAPSAFPRVQIYNGNKVSTYRDAGTDFSQARPIVNSKAFKMDTR